MKRLLACLLLALPAPAFAAPPPQLTGFGTRNVSVTTAWVTVDSLWGGASPCKGSVMVVNKNTTALYVGGTDGDSSTNFASVCKDNCGGLIGIVVPADGNKVKLASSSGTLTHVSLLCGAF